MSFRFVSGQRGEADRQVVALTIGHTLSLSRDKGCGRTGMAKQTKRGRNHNRARVAGEQDYEVRYQSKKTRQVKRYDEASTVPSSRHIGGKANRNGGS
jgi:hypothetical protein